MDENFSGTFEWAQSLGLVFNKNLERKCVQGVWGMYASDSIGRNELLGAFPCGHLITSKEANFPSGTSKSAMQIHAAAVELSKGGSSDFSPLFSIYDDLDTIKKYSTYFSDDKELKVLKAFGEGLYAEIYRQNTLNHALIHALHRFDSSIELDIYTTIAMNFNSRAMGDKGFIPILDCFNHSDEKGMFIDASGDSVTLHTKQAYKQGEQVYISYGIQDMYRHAINYNYFDPHNQHFIQFGNRFSFPILSQQDLQFANFLSQSYTLKFHNLSGVKMYSINDIGAYFSEGGPTKKLLEVVKLLCCKGQGHTDKNKITAVMLKAHILNLLSQLDAKNNVENFGQKYMPRKFRRFYGLLQKEKQLICLNRVWVEKNL